MLSINNFHYACSMVFKVICYFTLETPSEKVGYAKKMAEGYLKSMGMGEFTPKTDMYSKQEAVKSDSSKVTRWKRLDDDHEFEFDI